MHEEDEIYCKQNYSSFFLIPSVPAWITAHCRCAPIKSVGLLDEPSKRISKRIRNVAGGNKRGCDRPCGPNVETEPYVSGYRPEYTGVFRCKSKWTNRLLRTQCKHAFSARSRGKGRPEDVWLTRLARELFTDRRRIWLESILWFRIGIAS